jgi:hypothetical protein
VGNVVDSAAATLNVGPDVVAPTVASASGTDSLRNVLVRFDERTGEKGTARECVALREDALIAVEKPHTVIVLIGRD